MGRTGVMWNCWTSRDPLGADAHEVRNARVRIAAARVDRIARLYRRTSWLAAPRAHSNLGARWMRACKDRGRLPGSQHRNVQDAGVEKRFVSDSGLRADRSRSFALLRPEVGRVERLFRDGA